MQLYQLTYLSKAKKGIVKKKRFCFLSNVTQTIKWDVIHYEHNMNLYLWIKKKTREDVSCDDISAFHSHAAGEASWRLAKTQTFLAPHSSDNVAAVVGLARVTAVVWSLVAFQGSAISVCCFYNRWFVFGGRVLPGGHNRDLVWRSAEGSGVQRWDEKLSDDLVWKVQGKVNAGPPSEMRKVCWQAWKATTQI